MEDQKPEKKKMQDLIGKTMGGYQIVEQIGKGGMATIFKAYQPSMDREVAIKVLPPFFAEQDDSFITRFKREAQAIAKLRHPNILVAMDSGQQDEYAYIVMEYVPAGTLKDLISTETLNLREIAKLVGQIASALDYAHGEGVVHRDIKPSNILLPKRDWALLTDFGLARMVGGSMLTQSGMTVGTPAYMSPEQGSGDKVDARSDIYSLGVMLYEMVVGEVPYTAETPMAVVVKHIVDPLPMPRARKPDLPEEVQRVILKSLAKNPDDRYQRAGEIATALDAVVAQYGDWSATDMAAVVPPVNEVSTIPPEVNPPETKIIPDESSPATQVAAASTSESGSTGSATTVSAQPDGKKKFPWGWVLGGLAVIALVAVVAALGGAAIFSRLNQPDGQTPIAQQQNQPQNGPVDQPQQDQPQNDQPGDFINSPLKKPDPITNPVPDAWAYTQEQLASGNLQNARLGVIQMMRDTPGRFSDLQELLNMLMEDGETEAAFTLLEAALSTQEKPDIESMDWLAQMAMDLNRYPLAQNMYMYVLSNAPGDYWRYYGLVDAFTRHGETRSEAERLFGFLQGLHEKYPDNPSVLFGQGWAYNVFEQYERALESFRLAIDLDPEFLDSFVEASTALFALNKPEEAEAYLQRAAELSDFEPGTMDWIGWHLLGQDRYESAIKYFRKAIEGDNNYAWSYVGLVEALYYVDPDHPDIRPALENGARAAFETQDVWAALSVGWWYVELGDCPEAAGIFSMVLDLEPDMPEALDGIESCQ